VDTADAQHSRGDRATVPVPHPVAEQDPGPAAAGEPQHHAALLGIGAYRPRRVVSNEEICRVLDSSPEWIVRRSGIVTRCFAEPDETLVEMASAAAGKALAEAGMSATEVEHVLIATMSDTGEPGGLLPGVAARLGLRGRALQVSAACAGFTVGLGLAAAVVRAGDARNVLVIGVERMSDILDPHDRGTAFIFSDGAGAALVGRSAEPGIGRVVWGTHAHLRDAITVQPVAEHGGRPLLRMEGRPVFRWATTELPGILRTALERSGLTPADIQAFVPHQANLRIIKSVSDSMGFPGHVAVARDVVDQGNASAASIPLALSRMRDSGTLRSGDLALVAGFGAGLTYAAMTVRVP
jgi:3-oxoacyl-(acyl-carrier-protein) synthase III